MDRPAVLVVWYYLPMGLLYAALLVLASEMPGSIPTLIASLTVAFSYPLLLLAYRRVMRRQPLGFSDPRARPWSVVGIAIVIGAFGGGWWISARLGESWPAWTGAVIIAVVIPLRGAVCERAARRRARGPSPVT